jgi:flavin reductase (DIM6/NTAB) family NADH-FMN oxidoreductase RutF
MAGSASGRDVEKFAHASLTAEASERVLAPLVEECPLVYECQVVHSADVLPGKLADEILASNYRDGDYHRIYYGKILATLAAEDAADRIAAARAEAR